VAQRGKFASDVVRRHPRFDTNETGRQVRKRRKNATFPAKRENIDDMSFMRALVARMMFEHAIDQKLVYVFGYSNGGHMAFRLAMEAPAEIAAIASVAASLPTPDASLCPQRGRTSRAMLINGTADPIN
jgi:polyhydroxybutyrate depolymerase